MKWFVFDIIDRGMNTFETQGEAAAYYTELLEKYRSDAEEGCDEEVEYLMMGVVSHMTRLVAIPDTDLMLHRCVNPDGTFSKLPLRVEKEVTRWNVPHKDVVV